MSLVPPEAIAGLDQKTRRAGCRFRPPLRRTFGFRLEPTGEASVYSRPVLGARRTLKGAAPSVQGAAETLSRKERGFLLGPEADVVELGRDGVEASDEDDTDVGGVRGSRVARRAVVG